MVKPFGWCFIGCGTLAKKVARQIIKSGRHKIVSVYSRSFDKCAVFAKKYGATAYRSAEEAVKADGVDGVYVVTPHNSHFKYSMLAIGLNKPVLCEKSFTTDAGQAKELIEFAKSKQVYIAEAMWTWFAPVANQVKNWLDGGVFGKINKVAIKSRLPLFLYAKRVTDPAAAGGALLDMGVYPLTYLYRLFGKPDDIICNGKVSKGIDWEESVRMHFPSGESYTAWVSINKFGSEKLVIEGDKAKIKLGFFHNANRVKLVRKNGKSTSFSGDGSYLNEFDVVAFEIRAGLTESKFVPHEATIAVMEIMDECRKQMKLVYPFEM